MTELHDVRSTSGAGRRGHPEHADVRDAASDGDPDGWFRVIRRFVRCNPMLNVGYRVVVGAIGFAVVALGLLLIPAPGPGWLIVFAGLAVLATEFEWASRLLRFARHKVMAWTRWLERQSLVVRGLIGLACLLLLAGAVWWSLHTFGVPEWLPGWVPRVG